MFEGLDKDQKLKAARHTFEETVDIWSPWFKNMTQDFEFHAGGERQWDAMDLQHLKDEKRPALTFNLVKVLIRELIGAQEDAKREAKVVPVGREDQVRAEILNRLWRAVRRMTDADAAELEAFEKGVIGGVGYVVVDLNPKPGRPDWVEFRIEPISPLEIMADPASTRRDMRDSQYIFWNRWFRDAKFMQAYPDHADAVKELWRGTREEGMGMHESPTNSQDTPPGPTSPIDLPAFAADHLYLDRRKRRIRVVHLEYRCPKRAHYAVNPETGEPERLEPATFRKYKPFAESLGIEMAEIWEDEVYWLEFIGDRILFDDRGPANPHCFSIEAFVADRDHLTGEPVGLVRDLKDPQREVNKRSSTNLNHLTQQGAPGTFAEESSVSNPTEFAESLKKPGSVSWLRQGGMAGIKERSMPQTSVAVIEQIDRATRMFSRIGGVDVDMLTAQQSSDEPATTALLRYRKSILAVTKTLQNYHSFQSRILKNVLYLLSMVPDDQLEAMLGDRERWQVRDGQVIDQKAQQVINLAGLADEEWDVEMDVAAANTTIALLVLQILIQMAQVGVPVDPAIMIESLPIAQDKKNQMLTYIESQQAAAAEQAKGEQAELAKRLELDAAMEKFRGQVDLAEAAESARHNRELEQIQFLNSQRDYMVDLLTIAKDKQDGASRTLVESLKQIIAITDKFLAKQAPSAAPSAPAGAGAVPGLG